MPTSLPYPRPYVTSQGIIPAPPRILRAIVVVALLYCALLATTMIVPYDSADFARLEIAGP